MIVEPTPFPLFRLPLELRQNIYFFAIGDLPKMSWTPINHGYHFLATSSTVIKLQSELRNLVHVNRQVCIEVGNLMKERLQRLRQHQCDVLARGFLLRSHEISVITAHLIANLPLRSCRSVIAASAVERKTQRYVGWVLQEGVWLGNVLATAGRVLPMKRTESAT